MVMVAPLLPMVAQGGGGSALDAVFASATAFPDVHPPVPVPVAEAAVVAAVVVDAFAAIAAMVGIAAVAAMVVLPTTAFFKERHLTRAFTLMRIMVFSAILSSI